jgi:hypothetical protein
MKGWAVTLVGASFVLGAKEGSAPYVLLGLFPTLAFWGLDAICLRRERLYRCLFDAVRKAGMESHRHADFGMDTSPYKHLANGWFRTCLSGTLLGLYGPMTALVLGIALLVRNR